MSEDKKPAEKVEAAKPAEAKEAPKAEAPKKEKKPMDPKKKKNIIIWSIVGGVTLVGIIVAVVLVIVLTKVDYKESYEIAQQLESKIKDFYYDYDDCQDVVEDVEYKYSSASGYSSDVTDCKSAVSQETIDLVNKLGSSSGVAHDGEVKAAFDKFNAEFKKATGSVNADTNKALDIYDNWHKFYYNGIGMSFYSSTKESDVNTAAEYAANTGVDQLKTFGEQWKEKALEVVKARKAYDDATTGYSSLYSTYTSKRSELSTWIEGNLPKIAEIVPLKFEGDSNEVRSTWNDFVRVLGTKYGESAAEEMIKSSTPSYEDILNQLMK